MESNKICSFDIMGIRRCQKNSYPALYVDKITECLIGKYAKGIKNFTFNESYFPPRQESGCCVPAFVLTEALEQTFLMTFLSMEEYSGTTTSTVGMNNVKFKRKIIPGDTLEIIATLDSFRRGIAKGHVESFVNGEAACSLELTVAVNSVLNSFKPKG